MAKEPYNHRGPRRIRFTMTVDTTSATTFDTTLDTTLDLARVERGGYGCPRDRGAGWRVPETLRSWP
jgi:hypothetical protein